ncbi:unnamed protein product (macronuclear) [Paramecium tetraurelia]|uniref:Regulator of chromosome condensation 1/beta-lactamase-inhibitor protein II n=1 Tax=Paramecium tetraurelia TaxID=5888 RepID=A0DTS7_PARTE|nr:uncharacterized protein GSPATT00020126001 [Paramecium tetraurelia]CAK86444.1 unnamed protein product [Paramecium tetraurelia]|eukprot:XP_001453841.1 hypothetical protein (macronuclear) [Paramecium tetraurelia strain d4-2]
MNQANENQMQNQRTLNPELFSAPKGVKNQIIDPIIKIEDQLKNIKLTINEATFQGRDTNQLQQQQQDLLNNLEEKFYQLEICMKDVLLKFISYEGKIFIRLNENYYGNNQRIKSTMQGLAEILNLHFLEINTTQRDLVITKHLRQDGRYDINIRSPRNQGHGQQNAPEEEEAPRPQPKVIDKLFEQIQQPLPPEIIKEIFVQSDPEKQQYSIKVSFNKPEEYGCEITLYRIYQLDIYDQSLSLQPAKRVVLEFQNNKEQVQQQTLTFTRNHPLTKGELPFNEMVYLSVEAQNKYGWSSDHELCPIKLYVKYSEPLSLYLQGTISSVLIEDSNQFLELFQIKQIVNEEDKSYLIIEDYSLVLLEKQQIRNVSIKKDTVALVSTRFQACQWGSILNFYDENITQHFDVDPIKDFDLSPPYHINTDRAISKIACGLYHSLALTVDGNVLSWGYNKHGQLGNGMTISSMQPQQISYFKNNQIFVVDISAGQEISICRSDLGDVYTWGKMQNLFGDNIIKVLNAQKEAINLQCADQTNSQLVPRKINLKAKQIQAGYSCFAALSLENNLYMWGCNEHEVFGFLKCPELDDQIIIHLLDPIRINIENEYEIKDFQIGAYHCVVRVFCKSNQSEQYLSWGYNKYNQCGQSVSNKNSAKSCKRNQIEQVQKINKYSILPQKKFKSYSCGFDRSIFASFDNHIYTLSKNDTQNNDCSVFVEEVLAGDLISLVLGRE